jgi:hypothetical protein
MQSHALAQAALASYPACLGNTSLRPMQVFALAAGRCIMLAPLHACWLPVLQILMDCEGVDAVDQVRASTHTASSAC